MIVFPNQAPTIPTIEQQLQEVHERIILVEFGSYLQSINFHNETNRMIWYNPDFTAQQIFDSLSAKGPKVIDYNIKLRTYINDIATSESLTPDYIYPTNAYTISGDMVIVLPDPYIP